MFVAGTSKRFAEELYASIVENPSGSEPATGVIVEMSGSVLWDFCENWIEVSRAKAEVLRDMNEDETDEGGAEDEFRDLLDEAGHGAEATEDERIPDELAEPADEDGGEDSSSGDSGLMDALTGGMGWEGVLRQGIEQARWFRGASYRKWLDDGVPRSSTRIHWGDPAELAE